MRFRTRPLLSLTAGAALLLIAADTGARQELLWQHRNLGKAFYENPAALSQAAGEFKQALELEPNSPREHVNYGLALLRAGKNAEGVAELEKARKMDPAIPHTWFNLGIEFKRQGQFDRALAELRHMVQLVPDE